MSEQVRLKDQVALVTGAGRGIGKAIAEALVAAGAKVGMTDILEQELQETAGALNDGDGIALPVVTDITDPAQVDVMVARIEDELGSIDIAIHNAGTLSCLGPVWEADPERWFRDVRVNLYGTFLCCRAVTKRMVERGKGRIVNMVGGGISGPFPQITGYASSKAGLMRFTESLAAETREHGIKVFSFLPGTVLTEMTKFISNDPDGKKWLPGFGETFRKGGGVPAEATAALMVRVACGDADPLQGRCLRAVFDLDEMLGRIDEIVANDLHTLRVSWMPR